MDKDLYKRVLKLEINQAAQEVFKRQNKLLDKISKKEVDGYIFYNELKIIEKIREDIVLKREEFYKTDLFHRVNGFDSWRNRLREHEGLLDREYFKNQDKILKLTIS